MKIILLNGPPRSGKDTCAKLIPEVWDKKWFFNFDRLSMPIKRAFAATVGANIDAFGNVKGFEEIKEQPIVPFGCSYRQWQIDFSEKFMKSLYGNSIFADLFINRHEKRCLDYSRLLDRLIVLVPDCGFQIELDSLTNMYSDDLWLIEIHRPDCDFQGDSRSYLQPLNTRNFVRIHNNGTLDQLRSRLRDLEPHIMEPVE